jgi:hypothetical protein
MMNQHKITYYLLWVHDKEVTIDGSIGWLLTHVKKANWTSKNWGQATLTWIHENWQSKNKREFICMIGQQCVNT